ncbi:putative membrane protein [Caulobacter sp. AP07]|uniref:FUSC family protein n=1 Tax=Caulobacter sp. AP07 TaxID=1144304 RepID=UPI000272071F|nr:FUSC family protein [Caulobacter sp. AP07]EJL27523.1 putative membrane protein [Caulobacter sp. AP07]
MPKFDRWTLLFSLNSFAAAMLALYVGFALGLPRPYWAMTTAYIVSQPLAGAVRSKAVYRLLGTLLGATAAVAMVPNLVNAPVLLCLAMALWVGGCLTISLLDRTPRSYVLMLAGYTAAIIGFPAVSQPGGVFEIAVSRVIEIGLGILCATLVHSLVFPRPVGAMLQGRLAAWLGEADRWALDLLRGSDEQAIARDRRHLAAAASEIRLLAVHLPFDTSRLRETTGAVRAFHDRMTLLIPLLSGLSDRMAALREVRDAKARAALDEVVAWIEAGAPREPGLALVERLEALAEARRDAGWRALLIESLLVRLAQAVSALNEAHALMARLRDPDAPLSQALEAAATGARRRMHSDFPLALLSGGAATVAILLSCLAWIGFGWGDGAAAPIMAAVFCCFFAALDDPVPAIKNFGLFSLVSLPLAALYMFAVLPALDGFPLLVVAMAAPLLILGLYIPDPRTMGAALAVIMGFCNALALQESFSADFASFLNGNLGQFVGLLIAIMVTAGMRSMGADASARRLLGRTWKGLARLARSRAAPDPAAFAAVLVDRLGLLTPKLAMAGPRDDLTGVDALRDLRVGMNLVAIQAARPDLSRGGQARIDAVLDGVGDHFSALATGRGAPPTPDLLARLDTALREAASRSAAPHSPWGVAGLVGLRRNLFPDAPAPDLSLAPEPAR